MPMRTEALSALVGLAKNYTACVKPLWVHISQAVAHNLRTDKQQRSPMNKAAVTEAAPTVEAKCAQQAVKLLSTYLSGCCLLTQKLATSDSVDQQDTTQGSDLVNSNGSVPKPVEMPASSLPSSEGGAISRQLDSALPDKNNSRHVVDGGPAKQESAYQTSNTNGSKDNPESTQTGHVSSSNGLPFTDERSADDLRSLQPAVCNDNTHGAQASRQNTDDAQPGQSTIPFATSSNSASNQMSVSQQDDTALATPSGSFRTAVHGGGRCSINAEQQCAAMWSTSCDQHFAQVRQFCLL